MRLYLTVEAQNATESKIASICYDISERLAFVTKAGLEDVPNYGTEFRMITIIPTCVDDAFWDVLGWKERVYISRKGCEADVRLRLDYDQFINATEETKYQLFINHIILSLQRICERSKGGFACDKLIKDILEACDLLQ